MTQARELERESSPPAADSTSTPNSVAPGHRVPESDSPRSESTAPKVTRSSIRRLRTLSRVYLALVVLLFIAVVVLVVLFNQVRTAAIGWEQEARQNNQASHDLGSQLGQVRDELLDAQAQLDTVQNQLTKAQDTIKSQSAQLADSDDNRAIYNQIIRQHDAIALKALDATEAYEQCVEGLTLIIRYRSNIELYDLEQVEIFEEQVTAACDYADEAHEELNGMIEDLNS